MVRFSFHGTLAPLGNLRIQITGGPTTFPLVDAMRGAAFSFQVKQSQVTVNCDIPRADQIPVNLMLMFAYYLVRGAIEGELFLRGRGAVLTIISCTIPGETEPKELDLYEDELEKLISISSGDYVKLSSSERGIQKHIHDLVDCIVNPLDSELNCGRAVDGFARLITPNAKNEDQRWNAMHAALNTTKGYTSFVSNLSKGPLHGALEPQDMDKIVEVRRRAWIIANRFLEYRKGGNVPLTDPRFPQLL